MFLPQWLKRLLYYISHISDTESPHYTAEATSMTALGGRYAVTINHPMQIYRTGSKEQRKAPIYVLYIFYRFFYRIPSIDLN